MEITSVGYRTDVMIRRLDGSEVSDTGDSLVVRSPAQPGFWWGNFLLIAGTAWTGEGSIWLARFADAFPDARHVAIGLDVADASDIDPSGFTVAGLGVDRNLVLTAEQLQPPAHPAQEVEIRQLGGDMDWQQSAGVRLACDEMGPAGGPEHAEFLQRRVSKARALTETGHGAWFGAFSGGRLLAQCGIIWTGEGLARYQDVETHPQARRRGLAGTLVHHAGLYALRQPQAQRLVIVADPAADAVQLYRALGFRDTEDQLAFSRAPG